LIKFKNILSEIKISQGDSEPDYDTAAKLIAIGVGKWAEDISFEHSDYKYGAYTGEAWEEVAWGMRQIGLDPGDPGESDFPSNYLTFYDNLSEFVDKLKELKLLYLEW